jgi:hypothetical protein
MMTRCRRRGRLGAQVVGVVVAISIAMMTSLNLVLLDLDAVTLLVMARVEFLQVARGIGTALGRGARGEGLSVRMVF